MRKKRDRYSDNKMGHETFTPKRDNFSIRSYTPGDEDKIVPMFQEIFGVQRSCEHWYWKYRDNPLGSHYISLAVAEDGCPAAHYGGYPVMLYLKTDKGESPREFLTFHLGDKMTRKEFRGVGFGKSSLLARTFYHFRDTFAGGDVPFGYGFGTHHSLRFGLLFLHYADIEPVSYRRIALVDLDSFRVNPLRRALSRKKVQEVRDVDTEWTDFFYRVAPAYQYLVKRDEAYVRWRYLSRPDRRYLILKICKGKDLQGWSVFFREGEKIIWGDALFLPGDSASVKAVLHSLRRHPASLGADYIECWFPQRPLWWDAVLRQIGFVSSPEPNDLHLTGPVFNDPSAPSVLRKYFYYTLGDCDLF